MTQVEFVSECSVELINTNASDDMVAMAAWVSNGLDSSDRLADRKGVEGLLNFLYRNRHMSPFEHGQFICKADVPLRVRSEWHRHRTQSYNEISTRYTEVKPRFYIPPRERPLVQEGKMGNYHFVAGSDEQYAIMRANLETSTVNSYDAYLTMLDNGIAKEVASYALPINMMTQFYFTANPRNLMAFLSLRNESHALYEIRQAAQQVEKILADTMPLTYGAFTKDAAEEEKKAHPQYKVVVSKAPDQKKIRNLVERVLDENRRIV